MPYYPPPQAGVTFATPSKTTPAALSAPGVATTAIRSDAGIQSPGGIASIAANVSTTGTTEKQIVSASLPANFMAAGTTFRVTMFGRLSTNASATTVTFRVRIGTTTLTGNIPTTIVSPNAIGTGAITSEFRWEALVTVRTNGAAGTVTGDALLADGNSAVATNNFANGGLIPSTTNGATVAVDTTATKIIEGTIQCANAGNVATIYTAAIEVLVM